MSEEMKQSFPNPTCPYCGMNMKSGDGSWWCMDKTCHEQLNPYGIAQTSDWKEGPAQPPKAKPVSASEYESAEEFLARLPADDPIRRIPSWYVYSFEFANRYAAERKVK
jgi:hypothetical protein